MAFRTQGSKNRLCISLSILPLVYSSATFSFGQQKHDFAGDYVGALAQHAVKLHIIAGADGSLSANIDSPDQRLFALPCTDLLINGQALSFTVPNVRGEWTGVMSADGSLLTGVWKQGRPMALNFVRGTESAPANPIVPIVTSPATVKSPGNPETASQRPTCTAMIGASYWNGSVWTTMIMAAHIGKSGGMSFGAHLKNPLNPLAGYTDIVTFKNPAAALTLPPTPIFCVPMPANVDPTVVKIGTIDVKKDHRELETCAGRCASKGRTSDDWMPDKRVQAVEIKRVSERVIEITPKTPLAPGQYILGGPPLVGYYDFSIGGGNAIQ